MDTTSRRYINQSCIPWQGRTSKSHRDLCSATRRIQSLGWTKIQQGLLRPHDSLSYWIHIKGQCAVKSCGWKNSAKEVPSSKWWIYHYAISGFELLAVVLLVSGLVETLSLTTLALYKQADIILINRLAAPGRIYQGVNLSSRKIRPCPVLIRRLSR
jgi:hypothetical protein